MGAETVRRILVDWAKDIGLVPVPEASLDRMVGYYEPYATSHDALDRDAAFQEEVPHVALALHRRTVEVRGGRCVRADAGLEDPRPK